jgi:hypothetical protein
MQSEGVVIAIVSTIITAIVATSLSPPSLPPPLGLSGVLSLGSSSQI